MKSIIHTLAFLCIPIINFAENLEDTCKWEIPTSISMDCTNGKDYQFQVAYSCELEDFNLTVYDKWGNLLYESKNIKDIWDASNNEGGKFVWMIEGKYISGENFKKTGTTELIK